VSAEMAGYQIDEIARKTGLTKRSVRYYEEIGLLAPPDRTDGGYRVYSDVHLARLTEIVTIRDSLGLSLQQIQDFVALREQVESSLGAIRGKPEAPDRREHLANLKVLLERQQTLVAHQLEKVKAIQAKTDDAYAQVLSALDRISKE